MSGVRAQRVAEMTAARDQLTRRIEALQPGRPRTRYEAWCATPEGAEIRADLRARLAEILLADCDGARVKAARRLKAGTA